MIHRFSKLLLHLHNVHVGGVFLFGGNINQSRNGFFVDASYLKISGILFTFDFLFLT